MPKRERPGDASPFPRKSYILVLICKWQAALRRAALLHEIQTVSHTHMQQARKFSQTASTSPPIAPHPSSPRPGDRYNLQNTLAWPVERGRERGSPASGNRRITTTASRQREEGGEESRKDREETLKQRTIDSSPAMHAKKTRA